MRIKYFCLLVVFNYSVLNAFQNFHGCCLAPDNLTGWIVTLDSIIVLKTTDGGAHWFEQPNNAAARRFFDVTCTNNNNVWTCGILGEITHSSNGGQTWVHQVQGLAKYATRIEFINSNLGWAVCGDGVVGKTTDGGNYWEQIFTPYAQAEFYGVSFINENEGWVVAGWPDSLDVGQGIIIHSSDGGFVWDSLYRSDTYEDFFDVHFFDQNTGIVVGGNETDYSPILWKTTDGGNSWNPIQTPENTFYLRALDFVDNLHGWAVGRFGSIIRTTDGGNTWTFQTNPATLTLFDVDFSDYLHGIACGYGIILYTTDGGNTWNSGEIFGIVEQNERNLSESHIKICPSIFRNFLRIKIQSASSTRRDITDGTSPQSKISLRIYNASGRLVKSFVHQTEVLWKGDDELGNRVPAGIYFVRLDAGGFTQTEKVILLD